MVTVDESTITVDESTPPVDESTKFIKMLFSESMVTVDLVDEF